jgi:DNA-binding NarL/FixJ family response regulator
MPDGGFMLIVTSGGAGRRTGAITLPEELTAREIELLTLIAGGSTNAEIAERLVISPLTVKSHVSRILTKMSARDRTQLVVVAYESGLVVPGKLLGIAGGPLRRGASL